MDKLTIEKILSVDLNVLTKNGEHHTISFMDFRDCVEGSSISVNTKDTRRPKCLLDIHLECNEFNCGVDVINGEN